MTTTNYFYYSFSNADMVRLSKVLYLYFIKKETPFVLDEPLLYKIISTLYKYKFKSMRNFPYLVRSKKYPDKYHITELFVTHIDLLNKSLLHNKSNEFTYLEYDAAYKKKDIKDKLNTRIKDFIPWKIYATNPIYTGMDILHFDPSDRSYFNKRYIMPEDIGRIITEFVGEEFIHNLRFSLIIKKKGGRDSIRKEIQNTLYTWRKCELFDFSYARPYNYVKNIEKYENSNNTTLSINMNVRKHWTKMQIINNLMNNINNKELFYPFYRDVILLTPLVKKRRYNIKIAQKNKMITLWRQRHADNTNTNTL